MDMYEMCLEGWDQGYSKEGDQWFIDTLTQLYKDEIEEERDRINYRLNRVWRDELFAIMDTLMEGNEED
jgi:hypothetical protein